MPGSGVRLRFAPSPTGRFHVGNARSALFNWAFALHNAGTLVLRIEDTDAERSRPEWVEDIVDQLAWLGMGPNTYDGPTFQSHNVEAHREAIASLLGAGIAYYCDCSRQQIDARTGTRYGGYDGLCRDRGLRREPGRAVRFRTPDVGSTRIVDLIRGEPEFDNALIEDFVIARGDGSPIFLLANVVDDVTTGITHVIRAEEHLPNAPKQQLLWDALASRHPVWAHAPILVNEKRQKLSKRRDNLALASYRDEGYTAGALRNYLMLLGWAPPDGRELLSWDEVVADFDLRSVNSSPACFDVKKLRAFNGAYIRAMSTDEFREACQPWLTSPDAPWPAGSFDEADFAAVAELARTRVAVLSEIVPLVDFLFLDMPVYDEVEWAKGMGAEAAALLDGARRAFENVEWHAATLKAALEEVGSAEGLKLKKAQAPIRVAVTGRTVGLPLFDSLEVLGRERTIRRIGAAMRRLTVA